MSSKKKQAFEVYGEAPRDLNDHPFYGIKLDEDQLNFANAILNPEKLIVFCDSKAGTGKTTIATGVAGRKARIYAG